jgi:DNA polymerase bacteriophage-type
VSILHLDFETRSTVDLKKTGLHVYATHPSTDVLLAGFAFDEEPVQVWHRGERCPERLWEHISRDQEVWCHNAQFEIAINNNITSKRYGWPFLSPRQTICTMTMAYAMSLPGSLEKAAAAVGITEQKDMAGQRLMLQLAKPRDTNPEGQPIWWEDPEKLKRLADYCRQDVAVERELGKRLMRLSSSERGVWLLDQRINDRGIQVDIEVVKRAIEIVRVEKSRLDKAMHKLTRGAVVTCTATGQLTDWLKWRGVNVEGVAKADVIDLLKEEGLPDDARQALLLRQEAAKSSTAKLEAMLHSTSADGRIRGIFQYHGAGTGRWAGRRIQPQNFPRPKLESSEIEAVFRLLECGA